MRDSLLEQARAVAYAKLDEVDGAIAALPLPVQTLIVVDSAQGIIDNGGLEYFFESDFVGAPPYSFIVDAFRRIGAEEAASLIEAAVRMFPFSEPHLHEAKRQRWLDEVKEDESHEFVSLSRRACGDAAVFAKLADFARRNSIAFAAA